MTVRKDICGECPFRRKGWQGWMGKNTPTAFATAAMTDVSVACHLQVEQTLARPAWEKAEMNAPRCRGALTMMRNQCKIPRDLKMAELVRTVEADRDAVFSHSIEFIAHHEAAKVKSWEFRDEGQKKKKAG